MAVNDSVRGAATSRRSRLRRRSRPPGSRPPRERGDRRRSFLLTLIAVVVAGGLPVAAAALGRVLAQEHRPDHPGRLAALAGRPGHVLVPGQGPADPATCRSTGRRASWRWSSRGASRARSSTRRTRPPPPIVWQGSWRTLEPRLAFAPHWENFGEGLGPDRLPAAAVQHRRHRGHLDDRDAAVVHARGLRLRAVPVPRAEPPVHAADRDDLPAGAVTIIPTYTIFVKLGWVGTWLPLLVPAFFANAFDVFLMRQYFMTIPPELDEAAAIDGAGPFRTLVVGRSCRRPGRSSSRSRSSTSSTRGTTSSGRCIYTSGEARPPDRSRSACSGSTASTTATRG